jgi:two-component system sensor kinase FixL
MAERGSQPSTRNREQKTENLFKSQTMKNHKQAKPPHKPAPSSPKQSQGRSQAAGKKAPFPQGRRRAGDTMQTHMEGLVSKLNQKQSKMGEKIRKQTIDLKKKNGQLRLGVDMLETSVKQVQVLTKAIEAAADGIFIIDAKKPKFPIIYSNPAFQAMTGYAENEVAGKNYFSLCGTEDDPGSATAVKNTIQRGEFFNGECLNFKKDGAKYRSRLRIAPVRGEAGAITHYVGIQTDITLMWERDREIKEQREELLHVTRVGKLAEFVSSLAHEISQPLTAILSYVQAAQRLLADREPQIKEILQFISNDDVRAIEVIRRMRMLLKKSEPEMKPLNINALIQDTIALVATDTTVRNATITTEFDESLPQLSGDRIQLQQVLLNLISNSFDALDSTSEARRLTIRTARQNSQGVIVSVSDTGSGISAPNLPKLFSHFFTSKADGLGMGLSISRSIVESHGGRLTGANNPERGATFSFTLPFKAPNVQ